MRCWYRRDHFKADLSCLDHFLSRLEAYSAANLQLMVMEPTIPTEKRDSNTWLQETDRVRINLLGQMRNEFRHAPCTIRAKLRLFDEACLLMLPQLMVQRWPPQMATTDEGPLQPANEADTADFNVESARTPLSEGSAAHFLPYYCLPSKGDEELEVLHTPRGNTIPRKNSPRELQVAAHKEHRRRGGKSLTMGELLTKLSAKAEASVQRLTLLARSGTMSPSDTRLDEAPAEVHWPRFTDLLGVLEEPTIQAKAPKASPAETPLLPMRSIWQLPELLTEFQVGDAEEQVQQAIDCLFQSDWLVDRGEVSALLSEQIACQQCFLPVFVRAILDEMLPAFLQKMHELRDITVQDMCIGQSMHEKSMLLLMSGLVGAYTLVTHNQEFVWSQLDWIWKELTELKELAE